MISGMIKVVAAKRGGDSGAVADGWPADPWPPDGGYAAMGPPCVRFAPGWGERQGQHGHQGERKGEGARYHHGRRHQDPTEDTQAKCPASSPFKQLGGVQDSSSRQLAGPAVVVMG
jgi:hypothetical protein